MALIAAAALLLGGCGGSTEEGSIYTATVELGKPAPTFTYPDMDGKTFSLASERGRVVLLYFWRYRCEECLKMFDSLHQLSQLYKDYPLTIITIDEDTIHSGSIYSVTRFFENRGYSFRTLRDDAAYIAGLYKILWTPTVVVVDRGGKIAYLRVHKPLNFTDPEFTSLMERLLSATAPGPTAPP